MIGIDWTPATLTTVKVVARKELVEILRDKRSLFVLLLLPVILYPLLLIGSVFLATSQQRKLIGRSHVVWVEALKTTPPALLGHLTTEPPPPETKEGEKPSSQASGWLTLKLEAAPADEDYAAALSEQRVSAVVRQIPEAISPTAEDDPPEIEVLFNSGVDGSVLVKRQILEALRAWRKELIEERLDRAGLSKQTLVPIQAVAVDRGPPGALLAKILAMLLVVLAISGAFYPALDLGAGEKERGTLETLLLAPVPRVAVAVGKFVAVFVVTLVCALLHVLSLGLTFSSFSMLAPNKLALAPDPTVLPAMLLVLVPLVALFSALALALATYAASYKEGQAYLTPVMMIGTLPAVAAALPGMDLTPTLCLVPVMGATLLLKALLSDTYWAGQVVLVVVSSFVYAGLAVRWVAILYGREEVLWRPAAAKAPDLFGLRGDTFGQERVPTFPQAVALGVLGLLCLWFLGMPLQSKDGWMAIGLVVTLVFLVALPAVAYAKLLGCDLKATFRFQLPSSPLVFGAAVFLALGCVGIMLDVQHLQEAWTGPISEKQIESTRQRVQELVALGPVILVILFAVLPAVCEEVMFRGFVLTGLQREGDSVGPVLVTALMFAIFHLDPARLLPTFLVGAVLGAVVVRGGSLFPAILMHFLYNATILALEGYGQALGDAGLLAGEDLDQPTWLLRGLAVVCLALGAGLLVLAKRPAAQAASAPISMEPKKE